MSKFTVQFWGVRGSLPAPKTPQMIREITRDLLNEFASNVDRFSGTSEAKIDAFLRELPPWKHGGFGGDTSCVEVLAGETRMVIDAGSGLRRLGQEMMRGPCGKGQGEVHLFFTHFHWDHIIGLPFFTPIFIPGNRIHFYAVQPELEACVRQTFQKPFFPVPFESLPSSIEFHKILPRVKMKLGHLELTPYELDHPDPCWGYRVEAETTAGRKSYAHCVDNEATRISPLDLGRDNELYHKADLCFFDAQYTLSEFFSHMNWGHSAAPIGLEIALREGVKQIYFAHHDPAASDRKLADAERQTRDFLDGYRAKAKEAGRHLGEVEWHFARDGDFVELGELS